MRSDLWEQRRSAVMDHPTVKGLEYVDVLQRPTREQSLVLQLRFIPSRVTDKEPTPDLSPSNIRVAGPFGELWALSIDNSQRVGGILIVEIASSLFTGQARHLTTEMLVRLVDVSDIDPFFESATFRLRPPQSGSQALVEWEEPEILNAPPLIDYLNKDYASFRRLMLDSMLQWDPSWQERNAADLGMTIVEILAYAADQLSYYQDAVGTERALETARLRVSIRRHLRLIGYRLHDGCNARAWVHVAVATPVNLPRGTRFVAAPLVNVTPRLDSATYDRLESNLRHVYESMHDASLAPEQNQMAVYAWGAKEFSVKAGSTQTTLEGHLPSLRSGNVIVFEYPAPEQNERQSHAVRLKGDPRLGIDTLFGRPITEIVWLEEDALPTDLPIASTKIDSPKLTTVVGNIVLADHGKRRTPVQLPPVSQAHAYRPVLPDVDIALAEPYKAQKIETLSATDSLKQDPDAALATAMVVSESQHPDLGQEIWHVKEDLLMSGPGANDFVVEIEGDGTTNLRFGDGRLGRKPAMRTRMTAAYRLGNGTAGNVAANAINHVVCDDPSVLYARNPVPAQGGAEAQSATEAILLGPYAFMIQQRCVNEEDYRLFTETLHQVQGVFAERSWWGQRSRVRLFVQRTGGQPEDREFLDSISEALEPRRIIGTTLEVRPPRYVPIALDLSVVIARKAPISPTQRAVFEAFSANLGGFFSPDRFTFGTSLYESQIVEWAMKQKGVLSSTVRRLEVIGRAAVAAGGVLRPHPTEILCLDLDAHPSRLTALTIEFSRQ